MIVFYNKIDEVVALKQTNRQNYKTTCCEKFTHGKRCKRCPCYDL